MPTTKKSLPLAISGTLLVIVVCTIAVDIVGYASRTEDFIPISSDSGPTHVTAGYHLLIIPIFISVWIARRFIVSAFFTLAYVSFHVYSLSLRVQGCFLGEDICPPIPLIARLIDRTVIVDYLATAALAFLVAWHLYIFIRPNSRGEAVNYP